MVESYFAAEALKLLCQTYGYEHIETLHRLEKLGLLCRRTTVAPSRSPFSQCRRLLRLTVDDVDEFNPNDISYVYSGYAPLSVRLVQCAMQKIKGGSFASTAPSAVSLLSYVGGGVNGGASFIGREDKTNIASVNGRADSYTAPGVTVTTGWRGYEEVLKLMPGKAFEITQTVEYGPETNAAMARAKRRCLCLRSY